MTTILLVSFFLFHCSGTSNHYRITAFIFWGNFHELSVSVIWILSVTFSYPNSGNHIHVNSWQLSVIPNFVSFMLFPISLLSHLLLCFICTVARKFGYIRSLLVNQLDLPYFRIWKILPHALMLYLVLLFIEAHISYSSYLKIPCCL